METTIVLPSIVKPSVSWSVSALPSVSVSWSADGLPLADGLPSPSHPAVYLSP